MSIDSKKFEKLITDLNTNIEILTKVTALSFGKEALLEEKATKQEQVEVLEDLTIPDNIIALIIGSTIESVQALRSQRKAKAKKVQKNEPEKQEKATEVIPVKKGLIKTG